MGRQHEIGSLALDDVGLLVLGRNDDRVADNRGESVDLGTKLDLDRLAFLELDDSLLLVGLQRGVRSDIGARRDGGGMSKACVRPVSAEPIRKGKPGRLHWGVLLPLETFFPRQTLEISSSSSWSPLPQMSEIFSPATHRSLTAARTFSEISAAVLYLVKVSGLLRV